MQYLRHISLHQGVCRLLEVLEWDDVVVAHVEGVDRYGPWPSAPAAHGRRDQASGALGVETKKKIRRGSFLLKFSLKVLLELQKKSSVVGYSII